MSEEPPTVNLNLLGEECYITEFIQVRNPCLRRISKRIGGKTVDEKISKCAAFVAKHIEYPFNYKGKPTAESILKVFKWWNGFYLHEHKNDYAWLTPAQTLAVGKGICFDSACLLTTLLRIKGLKAWTVLGAVLKTSSKRVLGMHAWTETVNSLAVHIAIETTVHPDPPELLDAEALYKGKRSITYDPIAWFNDSYWHEDKAKTKQYRRLMRA